MTLSKIGNVGECAYVIFDKIQTILRVEQSKAKLTHNYWKSYGARAYTRGTSSEHR